MLRRPRLNKVVSTDTIFSNTKSIEGHWCAQVFHGCTSKFIEVHGMKTKSEFPEVHKDFLRERGIPHTLQKDNAKSKNSAAVKEIHQELVIRDEETEPHHPQQNPVERGHQIPQIKSQGPHGPN